MSFEPVTRWALRCDGITAHGGQCTETYHFEPEDHEEGDSPVQAQLAEPTLDRCWERTLTADGWLAVGGTLMCPRHVAAQEYMLAASVDGLPFEDAKLW